MGEVRWVFYIESSAPGSASELLSDFVTPSRYLIAGDLVHHIFISDYKTEYPNAKLIGVEGVPEKNPKLKFDGGMWKQSLHWVSYDQCWVHSLFYLYTVYGKDPVDTKYGYEDEVSPHRKKGEMQASILTGFW